MRIEKGKMERVIKPFKGISLKGHGLSDPVCIKIFGLQNESCCVSQSRRGALWKLCQAAMKETGVLEGMARVPH